MDEYSARRKNTSTTEREPKDQSRVFAVTKKFLSKVGFRIDFIFPFSGRFLFAATCLNHRCVERLLYPTRNTELIIFFQ